uniref:RWP-RK domain-containing protein n=1 Tax=Globisporangium ultimum (strain ATCC 200006 / CBS 805.95 / DAOM BR144) TaxID=431595 RepID=K3WXP2_GLOUD
MQAAERLGICEAALKRICRRNHIKKWPYRHLQSIRRRMAHLEGQENATPSNAQCQEERTQDLPMKGKAKRRRSESPSYCLTRRNERNQSAENKATPKTM